MAEKLEPCKCGSRAGYYTTAHFVWACCSGCDAKEGPFTRIYQSDAAAYAEAREAWNATRRREPAIIGPRIEPPGGE